MLPDDSHAIASEAVRHEQLGRRNTWVRYHVGTIRARPRGSRVRPTPFRRTFPATGKSNHIGGVIRRMYSWQINHSTMQRNRHPDWQTDCRTGVAACAPDRSQLWCGFDSICSRCNPKRCPQAPVIQTTFLDPYFRSDYSGLSWLEGMRTGQMDTTLTTFGRIS